MLLCLPQWLWIITRTRGSFVMSASRRRMVCLQFVRIVCISWPITCSWMASFQPSSSVSVKSRRFASVRSINNSQFTLHRCTCGRWPFHAWSAEHPRERPRGLSHWHIRHQQIHWLQQRLHCHETARPGLAIRHAPVSVPHLHLAKERLEDPCHTVRRTWNVEVAQCAEFPSKVPAAGNLETGGSTWQASCLHMLRSKPISHLRYIFAHSFFRWYKTNKNNKSPYRFLHLNFKPPIKKSCLR